MNAVETIESGLRAVGGAAILLSLLVAVISMVRSARRPVGHASGPGAAFLRAPILLLATLIFLLLGALLWKPLPLQLTSAARLALDLTGAVLLFAALALYFWGLRSLGASFATSSGYGVRLPVGQRLVTEGPYRWVRHPMYLAVILAGLGALLLYRTWAALLFAVMMLGLVPRARREERALAEIFGAKWQAYARRVPAWVPRFSPRPRGLR